MSPRRPRRKGGSLKDGERRQIARASRQAAATAPAATGTARILCDGGSRGNPGPAAIAAVLLGPDGAEEGRLAEPIGRATAAEAEYRAILLGLGLAVAHGVDPVEVCSDSRLAIAALEGRTPDDPGLAALVRGHPRHRRDVLGRALDLAPARGERGRRRARPRPPLGLTP